MKFIVCYFKPIPLLEIDSQFIQKHILSHSRSLGIHLVYSSFGFKTLHWCFVKSWSNFHDQFIRTFFQMENGLFFLYHRGKPMLATKEVQKFVKEPVLASFDASNQASKVIQYFCEFCQNWANHFSPHSSQMTSTLQKLNTVLVGNSLTCVLPSSMSTKTLGQSFCARVMRFFAGIKGFDFAHLVVMRWGEILQEISASV